MMVLPRPGVVFFAYPKAGSSSIEHALRSHRSVAAEAYARAVHPLVHRSGSWKHMNVGEFQTSFGHFGLVESRRWLRAAVVRNPWDRLVSVWSYQRQHIPEQHPMARVLSFSDYVKAGGSGSAFLTFSDFTRAPDGSNGVDMVLRVEQLGEDFDALCTAAGIAPIELLQLNRSVRPSYRQMYDDETRELVAVAYAEDIDRFGYEF